MNTEKAQFENIPTGLMVQRMSEPMGVGCQDLRFSWIMNSTLNDTMQTAFRILVSASREKLQITWGMSGIRN